MVLLDIDIPSGAKTVSTGTLNTVRNSIKLFLQCYNEYDLLRIFGAVHTGCLEWAIYLINIVDNRADIPFLKEPPATVIGIVSGQAAQFLVQVCFQFVPVGRYWKALTLGIVGVPHIPAPAERFTTYCTSFSCGLRICWWNCHRLLYLEPDDWLGGVISRNKDVVNPVSTRRHCSH